MNRCLMTAWEHYSFGTGYREREGTGPLPVMGGLVHDSASHTGTYGCKAP